MHKKYIVAPPQLFSKSLFWQAQRAYYHGKGQKAWSDSVPFYITSNPFIAERYAVIVARFMQEWQQKNPSTTGSTFYIVELGAGSGQFSFYFLKALNELLAQLQITSIQPCLIMTDFTESNINAWNDHPQLKPYLQAGTLDMALFDIEQSHQIRTIHQKITLNPGTINTPLIVIANYLFDSIVNDIFHCKDEQLSCVKVALSTDHPNHKTIEALNYEKLALSTHLVPTNTHFYQHALFDPILEEHQAAIRNGYFLFPIGALNGLEQLNALSNGKMMLLTSDKGYTHYQQMRELPFPEIDFHGSFSLMVNYQAISSWFTLNHGAAQIQSPRDGLVTAAMTSGVTLDQFPETALAIEQWVEKFSPTDYFNLYEHANQHAASFSLEALASMLSISGWDPHLFHQIYPSVSEKIRAADTEIVDFWIAHFKTMLDNFFYLPQSNDIFFQIGSLYYHYDLYEKALDCYEQSIQYFGESFETYYNIALAHHYNAQPSLAKIAIDHALRLNPSNNQIQKLSATIKKNKKSNPD